MTQPVSVIVTCFNLERYIGEAIRSVLAQQFSQPFELIVVDDCSTDESPDLIRSFAEARYIRTAANGGVLLAMLDGIRAAAGEFIFFLDGDDVWEPGKLSACLKAFEADPACALATHDLSFIDAEGRLLSRQSRPAHVLGQLASGKRGAAVIDGILHLDDYVWLGSALAVRKSLGRLAEFDSWARSLPDPRNTYQDWPLAFWIASLPGVTAAYVPEKLFRYRLHGANYSGDASTAARAIRNLVRTRNTLAAMEQLADEREGPATILETLRARARAYDYLLTLYRGRRLAALSAFPGAIPNFLKQGVLAKELVRIGGIFLLGPDRFTRWASMRSV